MSTVDQPEYTAAGSSHFVNAQSANPNILSHPPHLLGSTSSAASSIPTPLSSFPPTSLNPSSALGSIIHSTATASSNPVGPAPAPSDAQPERERAPAPAWDDGTADGAAYGVDAATYGAAYVVGDPDDPYLDGMYEDETGLASVCC
jgi:hypothetical protein